VGVIQGLLTIQQGQQESFFPATAGMAAFFAAALKVVERCQAVEGADVDGIFGLLIPVSDFLLATKDLFAYSQVRAIISEACAPGAMLKKPQGSLASKL